MIISRRENNLSCAMNRTRGINSKNEGKNPLPKACRSILPLSMETISIDVGCMWVTRTEEERDTPFFSPVFSGWREARKIAASFHRDPWPGSLYGFTAVAFGRRNSIDRKSHFPTRLTRFRFDFVGKLNLEIRDYLLDRNGSRSGRAIRAIDSTATT